MTACARPHEQRVNRELGELLNEFRLAPPGVQVLFGFLSTTPFRVGFSRITAFDRDVYVATLLSTAAATVLVVAPAAQHRLHPRQRDDELMVFRFDRFAILGLSFLAASLCGATLLVTSILVALPAAAASGLVVAVGTAFSWLASPLLMRTRERRRAHS